MAQGFWNRLDKGGEGGCWTFIGARDVRGYGRINREYFGESLAHRYAWRIANPGKEMPEAVMHDCDNPPCCNPAHLIAGTRLENNQQAWSRGLHPRGESHWRTRLSDDEIREIRERVSLGEKQSDLAREYDCSQSHISKVVNYASRKVA